MATTIDVKDMGNGGFFDCYGIFHRSAKEAIEATQNADANEGNVSVSNRD